MNKFPVIKPNKICQDSRKEFHTCLSREVDTPCFTCTNCAAQVVPNASEIRKFKRDSFVKNILATDASCFLYTGIQSVKLLEYTFKWLAPSAKENIKLWSGIRKTVPGRSKGRNRKLLSLYQEYLMTLVYIRWGFDNTHLAELFQVHSSYVSKLCTAWILFLDECLGWLIKWSDSSESCKTKFTKFIQKISSDKGNYWLFWTFLWKTISF